ncbi:Retrovirus-related Pol polyprotein from transposon 297 [Lucilia cuprina]|uniref:RNA-directed DNA polymerase n=1 Tax=Lucilia cuprina TaxID=7375 RepID=A0A0L0CEQ1_LUCCU|nr:Retrovirus-related Pol polyprotein from transposon 297 [Lucilia cuprina]
MNVRTDSKLKDNNSSNTYEERLENYMKIRKRIFESEPDIEKLIKVKRTRNRFKGKKNLFKNITQSVQKCCAINNNNNNNNNNNDHRAFTTIQIGESRLEGLLDSGASISILGKDCLELVDKLGLNVSPILAEVRTAGGKEYNVIGKTSLNVDYKGKSGRVEFYLVPDLIQKVYLGINFWREFQIAPEIFELDAIEPEVLESNFPLNVDNVDEHKLTLEQQKKLDEVKSSFRTYEEHGLGRTQMEIHTIELIEGTVPIKDRYYPVSPAVQELMYAEVDEMLKLGVIEISQSPWSNRSTLVRKPGKNRLCLDARKLNERTTKDAYPIQNIEGILSRLDETHYISSVDLKFAFWQIELEQKSRAYTAFTIPGRPLYQYVVMPFGLCNAAQRLCRLMDKVIPQELKSNVFVYLDDLLVISSNFEDHLKLLSKVAECLRNANLTIGLKKSKFCFKEIRYLGFIVGGGYMKTDPVKIEAIKNIPLPKSVREIRSFLGTAGWYRRFIQNFSTLTAPLTNLIRKGTKFELTEEAIESFNKLKQALTTAPVLAHPNFRKRFYIQCDASNYGIGAKSVKINIYILFNCKLK